MKNSKINYLEGLRSFSSLLTLFSLKLSFSKLLILHRRNFRRSRIFRDDFQINSFIPEEPHLHLWIRPCYGWVDLLPLDRDFYGEGIQFLAEIIKIQMILLISSIWPLDLQSAYNRYRLLHYHCIKILELSSRLKNSLFDRFFF